MTPDQISDLLARHEAMVWWVARRVGSQTGLDEGDVEELAAEVRARFVRAARTFDPAAGNTFGAYALRPAVAAARQRALELRNGGVHVPKYLVQRGVRAAPCVPIDAPVCEDGATAADLIPARPEAEPGPAFDPDFWAALDGPPGDRLTAQQREALALRFRDGLTNAAIARRWGRSRELVRLVVATALEKLERVPALRRLHEECR